MGNIDSLTELANTLDIFFKGLSECHLLSTYSVQLQASTVDYSVQVKFQHLVSQFVKNLQVLLQNIPLTSGHAWFQDATTQTNVNADDEVTVPNTNEKSNLGLLTNACVVEPKSEVEAKTENVKTLTEVETTFSSSTEIIVTCDPQSLAVMVGRDFVTTIKTDDDQTLSVPILDESLQERQQVPEPDESLQERQPVPEPEESLQERQLVPEPDESHQERQLVPEPDESHQERQLVPEPDETHQERQLVPEPDESHQERQLVPEPDESHQERQLVPEPDESHQERQLVPVSIEENPKTSTDDISDLLNVVAATADSEEANLQSAIFICETCEKTFSSARTLEEHLSLKHRNKGQCDICSQRFTSIQSLQEHCRIEHQGSGCFTCKLCKRRLMTRLTYRRHMDTHYGKKAALCDVCGKVFCRSDYLQKHYMTHTGVRPHACRQCPRRFVTTSQLKVHEKMHTGIKEHICDTCNKAFSRLDKLKDHMLRHLNVKRFNCSMCYKGYAEKRDLTEHIKVHNITTQ